MTKSCAVWGSDGGGKKTVGKANLPSLPHHVHAPGQEGAKIALLVHFPLDPSIFTPGDQTSFPGRTSLTALGCQQSRFRNKLRWRLLSAFATFRQQNVIEAMHVELTRSGSSSQAPGLRFTCCTSRLWLSVGEYEERRRGVAW